MAVGSNWAGNVVFRARHLHRPGSVEELRRLVARSRRLRVLGTGHSFTPLADSTGDLVSLAGLPGNIAIDRERRTVTVGGGISYAELTAALHVEGFALPSLASLPHISVAGACATGTHGSGDSVRCLAAAVRAMEIVTAEGDVVVVSREADGDAFAGMVVGLGAFGVVTSLTLDVEPAFAIRSVVYDGLARDVVADRLDEVFASAYSVSLFTDWRDDRYRLAWLKQRDGDGWRPDANWMGATLADGPRHPAGRSPTNLTDQSGEPGPAYQRLPHFRPDHVPSSGHELQSEYLVPRRHAAAALDAVFGVGATVAPVLQISEVRSVAADDLWLSPAYGRDTVGIHFTWIPDTEAVLPVMALVEQRLAGFEPRPHWGKLFSTPPAVVAGLYERFDDFRALARRYDPEGKFRNGFLDRYVPR